MDHPFPFDPTYGYTREALLTVPTPPEPVDFAAFWRDTCAQARAIDPRLAKRLLSSKSSHSDVYEIEYDGLGGFRVGGWLTVPRGRQPEAFVVHGHGYGGRDAPDLALAQLPIAILFPCARGFHRSARQDWPDNASGHVVHGIASRATYSHRLCVADLWTAATALEQLFPAAQNNLHYAGGSFGGGVGAMALAWDPRFTKGFLDVPSFGNQPLRLSLPCVGSGGPLRDYYLRHPDSLEVIQYFDAALCATYIKQPTLVAAASFDPAVPPPGQVAVYNAIPAEKKLVWRTAAHFEWPGKAAEDAMVAREVRAWFDWES